MKKMPKNLKRKIDAPMDGTPCEICRRAVGSDEEMVQIRDKNDLFIVVCKDCEEEETAMSDNSGEPRMTDTGFEDGPGAEYHWTGERL